MKNKTERKRNMSVLEFIKVVILGIVEGITEWLPISSTGHMILVDEFIKMDMTTEFKDFFLVVIQLGAILAVVVLYWSKLWPFYIRQIPKKKKAQIARKNPFSRIVLTFVEKFCDKDKWILWFKILVACIPTIVIALPFNDYIEEKFNNYVVVAIALIVYGVIFIIIENYNKRRKPICTSLEDLSFATAFKIGIFQVLSVIPGTSRSGATIVGALIIGVSRGAAAEFTFYLAIPVMFGASLLKIIKSAMHGLHYGPMEVITLLVGMIVAFIISLFVIRFLMDYIRKHDFTGFGWYRIILGIVVIAYFAISGATVL